MISFVEGAGGARLAVRTAGDPAAPAIVLLHGWGQSGAAWSAQRPLADEFFLIAPDLRGHGESDSPEAGYADPAVWAADLAAVLALAKGPATLVGWSYGGLVITDYLREGGSGVASIVLVGALTEIGRDRPGGAVGPVMKAAIPDVLSADPAVAVPAVTRLAEGMTSSPAPGAEVQRRVGATLAVRPAVRKALFKRDVDSADVLAGINVPTLVVHGTEDTVVDPSAAEYAIKNVPGAKALWLSGVGHMPFVECVEEFNGAVREHVITAR
ncbi:alpha/beta fold hydrolase [Actinokineospora sp. HUAS TT18]|uniref:alpha/beta fold hydrolase n=1 Tax=Actinokineospora sp. HUAS TT18 TaxID=3447451 RepID=UPI003F51E165